MGILRENRGWFGPQVRFRPLSVLRSLHRKFYFCAALLWRVSCRGWLQRREIVPQIRPDGARFRGKRPGHGAGGTAAGGERQSDAVPITILMNGKFYDASAYKASPCRWRSNRALCTKACARAIRWDCLPSTERCTALRRTVRVVDRYGAVAGGGTKSRRRHSSRDVPVGLTPATGRAAEPRRSEKKDASRLLRHLRPPRDNSASSAPQNPPGSTAPAGGSNPANGDDLRRTVSRPTITRPMRQKIRNNSGAADATVRDCGVGSRRIRCPMRSAGIRQTRGQADTTAATADRANCRAGVGSGAVDSRRSLTEWPQRAVRV